MPGILGAGLALVLVALCVLAFAWRAEGGRWFVVRTPSMGRAAPVGTLLLTTPASIADVHVGELITFHAPGTGMVFSHRVVQKTAAGLRTRGDINPVEDPWVLTRSDLIGRVAHRVWGLGWVLRGMPLLLLCIGLVWLVTAFVADGWRSPLRLVGVTLSVSYVAYMLHPWVDIERIGAGPAGHGLTVRAVSTGVLPIRASAVHGGGHVRLLDGQVGAIAVRHVAHGGAYDVAASPSLSLWWWVLTVFVCLLPLLFALVVGFGPAPPATEAAPA